MVSLFSFVLFPPMAGAPLRSESEAVLDVCANLENTTKYAIYARERLAAHTATYAALEVDLATEANRALLGHLVVLDVKQWTAAKTATTGNLRKADKIHDPRRGRPCV